MKIEGWVVEFFQDGEWKPIGHADHVNIHVLRWFADQSANDWKIGAKNVGLVEPTTRVVPATLYCIGPGGDESKQCNDEEIMNELELLRRLYLAVEKLHNSVNNTMDAYKSKLTDLIFLSETDEAAAQEELLHLWLDIRSALDGERLKAQKREIEMKIEKGLCK